MQFSLAMPADMRRWVDARVARDGYGDVADYLRDLIERDQQDHEADVRRVRGLIDEGIASGIVDAEPEAVLDETIAGLSKVRD